jgi:hypothetical protein
VVRFPATVIFFLEVSHGITFCCAMVLEGHVYEKHGAPARPRSLLCNLSVLTAVVLFGGAVAGVAIGYVCNKTMAAPQSRALQASTQAQPMLRSLVSVSPPSTAVATVTAAADPADLADPSTGTGLAPPSLPTCVELVNVTDEHTYWRQDLVANRTTWLHLWAMLGQSDKLLPLVADGANVNARDAAGRTPAMVAAATGPQALPSLMALCKGAAWNPDATCARGYTVWQYLQQCGQLRAARALRSLSAP